MKLTHLITLVTSVFIVFFSSCNTIDDYEEIEYQITRSPYDPELTRPWHGLTSLSKNVSISDSVYRTVNLHLKDCQQYTQNYYKTILETIVDKKLAAVGYGSRYGVEGYYAPGQNAIYFSRSTLPSSNVVQEEFVHAAQDRVYNEGIQTYAGKTGASNIEFEAKLLMYMISMINGTYASPPPVKTEDLSIFQNWIITLGLFNDNASLPSINEILETSFDSKDYYYFINSFKESHIMYNYDVDYNLTPQLIKYTNEQYPN